MSCAAAMDTLSADALALTIGKCDDVVRAAGNIKWQPLQAPQLVLGPDHICAIKIIAWQCH